MKQTVASNTTAFVTAASLMQLRVQWPVVQVVLHLAAPHRLDAYLVLLPHHRIGRHRETGADTGVPRLCKYLKWQLANCHKQTYSLQRRL